MCTVVLDYNTGPSNCTRSCRRFEHPLFLQPSPLQRLLNKHSYPLCLLCHIIRSQTIFKMIDDDIPYNGLRLFPPVIPPPVLSPVPPSRPYPDTSLSPSKYLTKPQMEVEVEGVRVLFI